VPEWQQSEVANLKGRVAETAGKPEEAAGQYRQAVALDPYNVVALSNEGAALRAAGNLEGAKEALEKAVETSGAIRQPPCCSSRWRRSWPPPTTRSGAS
jgi:Flp pilus assembly protein TadD